MPEEEDEHDADERDRDLLLFALLSLRATAGRVALLTTFQHRSAAMGGAKDRANQQNIKYSQGIVCLWMIRH